MNGAVARPVLKWAGGKRQLLSHILKRLPSHIETYYEPFVGGGAVFFALAALGRFERAVLADTNPDVECVYLALREDVESVIRVLRTFRYDEKVYYEVRDRRPRRLDQRAARVIFLNKTGYNGLYRVNRSGRFNVPFGRYEREPKICDEENLRAAARTLQKVKILRSDFEAVCKRAKPGDAVYFDPPYVPLSKTANFTAYHQEPFGADEHERLAREFERLSAHGVHAVLSNSDTAETRRLYQGWEVTPLRVSRPINSDSKKRGAVGELLVLNRTKAGR